MEPITNVKKEKGNGENNGRYNDGHGEVGSNLIVDAYRSSADRGKRE